MAGDKYDEGKIMVDLIPSEPIEALATILTHGANKYAPNNWQKGISFRKIYASKERHRLAFRRGEFIDQESGYPHLWHEFCNLAFLIYYNHPDNYARYEEFNDFKQEWTQKLGKVTPRANVPIVKYCHDCKFVKHDTNIEPCLNCHRVLPHPNWEPQNGE